jgi:hypothetical protein
MPSYQAFNRRLNLLTDNFQYLFGHLLESLHLNQSRLSTDFLIDSMPIMLASGTRSKQARVAPEIAKCGLSAVKQTNFHGVPLHLIANRQSGTLPIPAQLWLKEGNTDDLDCSERKERSITNRNQSFWRQSLRRQAIQIRIKGAANSIVYANQETDKRNSFKGTKAL